MKTKYVFPMAALALMMVSCSEDTDDNAVDNFAQLSASIDEITDQVTAAGDWTITNFIDSGQNETADFNGYSFSFNADGSLVATNGTETINGTWSLSIDDDSDDDSSDDSSDDSLGGTDDDCYTCTVEQLAEVLSACSGWFVEKLERSDMDLEGNYSGYTFEFTADGTVSVSSGSEMWSGTWEASGSGNNIQVVLSVEGLSDIPDTWMLHEIELYNGESNVDLRMGDDRLRFRNRCTLGDFNPGGTSSGDIDFNIFFASPADFAELTEDWDIISHSANKIELIDRDDDGSETDLLTFEKN